MNLVLMMILAPVFPQISTFWNQSTHTNITSKTKTKIKQQGCPSQEMRSYHQVSDYYCKLIIFFLQNIQTGYNV